MRAQAIHLALGQDEGGKYRLGCGNPLYRGAYAMTLDGDPRTYVFPARWCRRCALVRRRLLRVLRRSAHVRDEAELRRMLERFPVEEIAALTRSSRWGLAS